MRETTIRRIIREELAALEKKEPPLLLKPEEVAEILKVEIRTLAQWRSLNKGPKYSKKCGIRYSVADIHEFLEGE